MVVLDAVVVSFWAARSLTFRGKSLPVDTLHLRVRFLVAEPRPLCAPVLDLALTVPTALSAAVSVLPVVALAVMAGLAVTGQ